MQECHLSEIKLRILTQCAFRSLREDKLEIRLKDCLDALREISNRQVGLKEAIAVLSEIEQGSGLVYRINEEDWHFCHRSFLDYFAAEMALELTEQELTQTISKAVNKLAWTSPIALALSEYAHRQEAKKLWDAAQMLFPSKRGASLKAALLEISTSARKKRK